MTHSLRLGQAVAAAVIAALVASCSHQDDTGRQVDPDAAAVTTFPGLTPATGEPMLDGIDTQDPKPGEIVTVRGPFDDRFDWSKLQLSEQKLTGRIGVVSDVSELLELEVLAGFYDRQGRFLGTARFVHHLGTVHEDVAHHDVGEQFSITVPPRFRTRVTAAAVGVPVLVNE